jgi:tetratricopeptide (TPR) repeat protein/predicted Ser/Thr protein kinase
VNDNVSTREWSLSTLVAQAADEYLDQLDRGEQPDVGAVAQRFPEIIGVLPQILPALRMIQEVEAGARQPALHAGHMDQLGDFRLIRELGRGGMGVVYEAEQISNSGLVALKMLPRHAGLSARQLARFQIEAQVASVLNHPHIVPILAVGCDQGIHYFAMRFIDGPSLADVLREQPTERGHRAGLAPREAARVALQAALALDHAHGMGILHRDIKPANLLRDRQQHVWVTDFGLAHFQGVSDLTTTGETPGTLRYMSPEQAAGQRILDPRTDVYGLGVTLYEMLTARPAFDASDRHALLRQIAESEPIAPRNLDARISRDLETIVLKAMAKEPDQRYATADSLARDLTRYLSGLPVLAERPGLADRAFQWSKRHHRALMAGGALLVVLAIGLIGGLGLLWNEQQRTRQALYLAQEARDREREALRFTFTLSDRIASRALERLSGPGSSLGDTDREFCQSILDYYKRISQRYGDDPEMGRMAAAAEHRMGFARMILNVEGAESAYRRSIDRYETILAAAPAAHDVEADLAYAYGDLALYYQRANDDHNEADCLQQVVNHVRPLAEQFPEVRPYSDSLTMNQARRLDLLETLGDVEEARVVRKELRRDYERAIQHDPEDDRALNNLAWLLAKRRGSSADEARQAVELARQAVRIAPERGDLWNTLGVACYRSADWNAARNALERSMSLRSGGDPYDWFFLAMLGNRQGRDEEARKWYDRARAWVQADPTHASNKELSAFSDEAAALLGLKTAPTR